MHRWTLGALALFTALSCLVLITPNHASAEDSITDQVSGDWKSMQSRKQVRDKIDKRVEKFMDELPFYKRPFARPRLKTATEPCWTLTFKRPDTDTISITCHNDKPVVTPDDGTKKRWTSNDGDSYDVTQTVHDDKIVQVFESDSGTRTNTYRVDGDNMTLDIRLASPQLPIDLTYTRYFERD